LSKRSKTIVWMLVAIGGLIYLAATTWTATFEQALRRLEWSWALGGVGVYLVAQTLLATRWMGLLKVHHIHISLVKAVQLTYLGLFYNNLMPGAVGGDLLKGWYVTHHSGKAQRLAAAVTVFVDRLVGLIGMILVGALASLFVGGDLAIPLGGGNLEVRVLIWFLLGCLVLGGAVFLSRRVRRTLLLTVVLEKLPFAKGLRQVDSAIRIYRGQPGSVGVALLLTAVIQGFSIVAVYMLCKALHLDNVRFLQCLIIMPIVWLISAAVPVPGGLGVMENLFVPFFARAIEPGVMMGTACWEEVVALAAALAVMNRLMICVCSLPGGLVPVFGGHLPRRKELEGEAVSAAPEAEE